MPDCELQPTCPYYINYLKGDYAQAMSGLIKAVIEGYCRGDYAWCGRYMAFKALERELKIVKSTLTLGSQSKGDK